MAEFYCANTEGLQAEQCVRIEKITRDTIARVKQELPISQAEVIVHVRSTWTIPETGLGGYSPNADYAFIHLDPRNPMFDQNIELELAATIAHELHHCARHAGVGYGWTLKQALMTEGLALVYEQDFRNGQIPMYANALAHDEISIFLARAKQAFQNSSYNHQAWFFGSEEQQIPKWTGYTLGYQLVKTFLERTQRSAAQAWNADALELDI